MSEQQSPPQPSAGAHAGRGAAGVGDQHDRLLRRVFVFLGLPVVVRNAEQLGACSQPPAPANEAPWRTTAHVPPAQPFKPLGCLTPIEIVWTLYLILGIHREMTQAKALLEEFPLK